MPIQASTWLQNVPVSAGQLNQDMYSYDGSYFASNGILFHANRPICQETYAVQSAVGSSPNGQWVIWGGVKGQGLGVIDTSALFGIGCDSPAAGAFFRSSGVTAVGSSGVPGQRGGWVLMLNFLGVGKFSSSSKAAMGAGWFIGGNPSVNDVGTIQVGSGTLSNAAYACNMFNINTATGYFQPGTLLADANSHNFTAVSNTVNTSGETPRFLQIWCGVNTNGQTVSTVPQPQTAFTGTTPITATLLNSTVKNSLNILNYPPMLNCAGGLSSSISNNTATIAPFTTGSAILDSYGGFSPSTHYYTVPLNGVYFAHANIILAGTLSTGNCAAGFFIKKSGSTAITTSWGGNYGVTSNTTVDNGCPTTHMLDLQAGDQIAAFGYQNSGAVGSFGSAFHSHFILSWMGALGTASTTQAWSAPDPNGYFFQAGTNPGTGTGDMVPIFNTKVANDLNFLINKPYCMVSQTSNQTGLTPNVFHTVVMNTVGGIVHGSSAFSGDNYGGWSAGTSNAYVAQVPGWYFVTGEFGMTPTSASTPGSFIAGINCPTSGGLTVPSGSNAPPDWYQQIVATTVAGPPAPTAAGLYYLEPGEYVQPQVMWQPNGGSGNSSTDVTNFSSTFSVMWVSN